MRNPYLPTSVEEAPCLDAFCVFLGGWNSSGRTPRFPFFSSLIRWASATFSGSPLRCHASFVPNITLVLPLVMDGWMAMISISFKQKATNKSELRFLFWKYQQFWQDRMMVTSLVILCKNINHKIENLFFVLETESYQIVNGYISQFEIWFW